MRDDAISEGNNGEPQPAPIVASQFDDWFRAYQRPLVRWLTPQVGDADTASDISQNAFIYLLYFAERDAIAHPRALLFKTAGWLAKNELRRRRRSGGSWMVIDQAPDGDDPPSELQDHETPEMLAAARQEAEQTLIVIDSLPVKARTAFRLSRLEGLTYDQIASAMGASKSSVEKYMIVALKRLRAHQGAIN